MPMSPLAKTGRGRMGAAWESSKWGYQAGGPLEIKRFVLR